MANYYTCKYRLPHPLISSSSPSLSSSSLSQVQLLACSLIDNNGSGANIDSANAPAPPLLDGELRQIYNSLNAIQRDLFRRCYLRLWDKIYNHKLMTDELNMLSYIDLIPDLMRTTKHTWRELSLLTKLWQLTCRGKYSIRSTSTLWKNSERIILRKLQANNIIAKYTHDPFLPHSRHYPQKCYIILTEEGVQYIKQILITYKQLIIQYHLQIADAFILGEKKIRKGKKKTSQI